ncbi:hypothetical protein J2Y45_006475 [Dyadobacter sp. BE34]|uniref:Uncharacterized protein n=1 Tax=Dyadobacter fermentans TaxID=94254 RepID=A0ABU1QYW6_9BACT|nr:hypothetical protein [Dyadobacter fermentans]MDR7042314.1 hypothetical protein [Dyadobacter sp. BE242]MDR7201312.1 hypothetical protein [Dyadobacter sp. BE34]MDR7215939.1 hypothetical protein [Dyadobacter sp. BE31]MDR7263475.1 hypothetical protein [Dyadobacter sp. BE32]
MNEVSGPEAAFLLPAFLFLKFLSLADKVARRAV